MMMLWTVLAFATEGEVVLSEAMREGFRRAGIDAEGKIADLEAGAGGSWRKMDRDTRKATAHYVSSPLADPEPVVFVADASVTQQDNATTAAPAATTPPPPAATTDAPDDLATMPKVEDKVVEEERSYST